MFEQADGNFMRLTVNDSAEIDIGPVQQLEQTDVYDFRETTP